MQSSQAHDWRIETDKAGKPTRHQRPRLSGPTLSEECHKYTCAKCNGVHYTPIDSYQVFHQPSPNGCK